METKLKTAPVIYPVTLAEVKEHLRVHILNVDEDAYINTLIPLAVEDAETFTGRRLITQTWYGYLNQWPASDRFELPFGQLQSVTAIKYRDTDEAESTLSASDYIVNTDADPGYVVLGYGESWPTTTLSPSMAIEIEFICGYGATAATVPNGIKNAIKMRVADRFEHRENLVVGGGITVTSDLKVFEHNLWKYKVWS